MADKALDCKRFDEAANTNSWKNSTLRSWLNGYGAGYNIDGMDYSYIGFFDTAFTFDEKSAIKDDYTNIGPDTKDNVFLLSTDEIIKTSYGFLNQNCADVSRQLEATDYAFAIGSFKAGSGCYGFSLYNTWWWTRTKGDSNGLAAFTYAGGNYDYDNGTESNGSVVPVIVIDKKSSLYSVANNIDKRRIYISYNVGEGNICNNPSWAYVSTGVSYFEEPEWDDNIFDGWYKDANYSSDKRIYSIDAGTTQRQITLYAKWIEGAGNYDIIYDLRGGSFTSTPPTQYDGSTGLDNLPVPVKSSDTFLGWYTSARFKKNKDIKKIKAGSYGTMKLYARWSSDGYFISFECDDGEITGRAPKLYYPGIGIDSLPIPVWENHRFVGWYDDDDFAEGNIVTEISETATGDITLYARWRNLGEYDYYIVYDCVGGGLPEGAPLGFDRGFGTKLPVPVKNGYKFKGWFEDAVYSPDKGVNFVSGSCTNNLKLYAKWEIATYNITYNLNGGKLSVTPANKYTYGTGIGSIPIPTRNGYTFCGWYTDSAFSDNSKITEISNVMYGDLELSAKWMPCTYSITYVLGDGVTLDADAPTTYVTGVGVPQLPQAYSQYQRFIGWYINDMPGVAVKIGKTKIGDLVLKPSFMPMPFNIEYIYNGGNEVDNPKTYTYPNGTTAFQNPTREHCSFGGWYIDGIYTEENRREAMKATDGGDVTLYALWIGDEYEITYELDGGVNNALNPSKYNYTTGVETLAAPTKEGYAFEGWYSDGSFAEDKKVTSISEDQLGDVTLFAKWKVAEPEITEYTITYELGGGTNDSSNPIKYTAGVGVASFKNPTKEGFVFAGWFSDAKFTFRVTSIATDFTGDIKLFANWTKNVVENKKVENDFSVKDLTKEISKSKQTIKLASLVSKVMDGAKVTYELEGKYGKDVTLDASKGTLSIKAKYAGIIKIKVVTGETDKYLKTSKEITVTVVPAKVKSLKVKTTKKSGVVKITWKASTYADGYEVKYGQKKDLSKVKAKTVNKKTLSMDTKKLKAKKPCYVEIRAYKKVKGGKVYSPVVKATLKKVK